MGPILRYSQAAAMYPGKDCKSMFMAVNFNEPHEFFKQGKGKDLFLFGE